MNRNKRTFPIINLFLIAILLCITLPLTSFSENAAQQFNVLKEELISLAPSKMTNLEIALFYHDHLVANYQYDTDFNNYYPYEFLRDKKGVCQAYAETYKLLMDHFGIPCIYVISYAYDHIWNAIELEGAWYIVDLTHDDPLYERPGRSSHRNFLISLEEYFSIGDHHLAKEDYFFSKNVTISPTNHPNHDFFDSSTASFVAAQGQFYGIVKTNGYHLAKVDVNTATVLEEIAPLPNKWQIPGGSYYSKNYTILACYNDVLYYTTDTAVYSCHLNEENRIEMLYAISSSTTLYCMTVEKGLVHLYTSEHSPSGPFAYTSVILFLPGDINGDGILTISDVTALINNLSDDQFTAPKEHLNIDNDHANQINIADVTALLNLLEDKNRS